MVNGASGETLSTVPITRIAANRPVYAAGGFVFYMDDNTDTLRRVGQDGESIEMPFVKLSLNGVYLPSPDGQSIAWSDLKDDGKGNAHVTLNAAAVDGSSMKKVVDEIRTLPTRPEPVHWSADGRTLYYSNMPNGIGGYILFNFIAEIQQVDLASGTVTPLLPDRSCACAAAFSPDDTRVAAINRPEADHLELIVTSVDGKTEQKFDLPVDHKQAGGIVWSPDGTALVVAAAVGNPDREAYSLLKVDLAANTITPLVSDDPRLLTPIAWPAPGRIWLNDQAGQAWQMDLATGKISPDSRGRRIVPAGPR